MRIIVADCSARYSGRLNASLPRAKRVILVKADQSCLIFSELGSYKPLNWMAAPCTLREIARAAPGMRLRAPIWISTVRAGAIGMRTLKAFPVPRICLPLP